MSGADPARAPHTIIELSDYCMSVVRDILAGRGYPLDGGGDGHAVEALLALVCALENGRIAEPAGWPELRQRIIGLYDRMRRGEPDLAGEPDRSLVA